MPEITNWNSLSSVSQGTVSVTSVSSVVLQSNKFRTYALIVNYGALDVTIGIEADAILNKGIVLPASGGFYEMSGKYGNNCRGTVTAIVDTTATTLNYMTAGGEI